MLHSVVPRRRQSATAIVSTALLIVGTSAFLSRPDPSLAADARVVTVIASDYAFRVPDTIAAGRTEFRLVNQGPALHHVAIMRLSDGKSLADLAAAIRPDSPVLPEWAVEVGGPNAAMPGGEANATLMLEPGRHVMLCFVPGDDGRPHMMKGMMKEVTVAPRPRAQLVRRAHPAADVVMTLADYGFAFSKPITAGTRTIRVTNAAAQPHEAIVVKLAPGATAAGFVAALEKSQGPPPGALVAGVTGIARGRWVDVTAEFTPGEYALICFVPDAKDGKPHVAHGMVKQFRVD
jgi:uncharacterized cupredoxin-like copper-binding protein